MVHAKSTLSSLATADASMRDALLAVLELELKRIPCLNL